MCLEKLLGACVCQVGFYLQLSLCIFLFVLDCWTFADFESILTCSSPCEHYHLYHNHTAMYDLCHAIVVPPMSWGRYHARS